MNRQPLLIQDAFDFGPPPPKSREAPWEKLYRFFFGDDVFISYSRADAIRYVPSLAARLAGKRHICFFDQLAAAPSEELPEKLKKKILRSTVFVLVGTRGAVASSFVRKEVELFRRTRRPFIPVDVDGALVEQEGWRDVVGVAKIREEGARVRGGDPSPEVVNLIKDSFRYTRRSQWLRASLLAGVSVIFITAVVSLLVIRAAQAEATAIQRQAVLQVAAANQQVGEARQSAQNFRAEAERAQGDADDARNRAQSATAAAEVAATQQEAAKRSMRRAQELERQSAERAADTARREAGARATLLAREPGRALDALALALEAAEESVARRGEIPEQVMDGLVASAAVADYALPLEDAGTREPFYPVISPDGEKIVTSIYDVRSRSSRLVFWDSDTGRISKTSASVEGLMQSLSFSRDGRRLVAELNRPARHSLIVWDVAGPRPTPRRTACEVDNHASYFTRSLALDSDGSHVLILGRDLASPRAVLSVCEIGNGRKEVLTGWGEVGGVAFTLEDEPAVYGKLAVPGEGDLRAALYFLRSGRKIAIKPSGDPGQIGFVGFGDDGSVILIGPAAVSPGRSSVYVQSADGEVRRFTGYRGSVSSVAFVAGQARVVVSDDGIGARVVDARSSADFAALRAHARGLNIVAFSPDDRTILTVGHEGKARLWDARTRRLRHTLATAEESLRQGQADEYRSKFAAFRDDGLRLVTANDKDEIKTWDVETGHPGCSAPGRGEVAGEYLINVSFMAGGDYILAAYHKEHGKIILIRFFDARTCEMLRTFRLDEWLRPGEWVGPLSFSHDGTAVITGILTHPFDWDAAELRAWSLRGVDVRGRAPIRLAASDVTRPPGPLRGFTFEGGQALVVTEDDTGRLWVSGKSSGVLLEGSEGGPHGSFRAVFSGDRMRVAGFLGKEARVWDARSGKLLVAFECDMDMSGFSRTPLSLSPDGSKLLVAGRDHTARLYPTSREGFLQAAKRLVGR